MASASCRCRQKRNTTSSFPSGGSIARPCVASVTLLQDGAIRAEDWRVWVSPGVLLCPCLDSCEKWLPQRTRAADILNTIRVALGLLVGFDTTLLHVVALSLAVSLSTSGAATVCGLPLGTALAVFRFQGAVC